MTATDAVMRRQRRDATVVRAAVAALGEADPELAELLDALARQVAVGRFPARHPVRRAALAVADRITTREVTR